jgi:hypothetical protein
MFTVSQGSDGLESRQPKGMIGIGLKRSVGIDPMGMG